MQIEDRARARGPVPARITPRGIKLVEHCVIGIDRDHVAIAIRLWPAFDRRIIRNRIRPFITLICVLKLHRNLRLIARDAHERNSHRRAVVNGAEVWMQRFAQPDALENRRRLRVDRRSGNVLIPGIIRRKNLQLAKLHIRRRRRRGGDQQDRETEKNRLAHAKKINHFARFVVKFSLMRFALALSLLLMTAAARGDSPADHLPPHITRLTDFGERADWSRDGKRILFLSKTFGDAMEIDLATKSIRNLTAHYHHHGYTRALYLANGDILLSGPEQFDPAKAGEARVQCFLSVLDKSLSKPAAPLGTKCSEGPAVSRKRMHIAWTHVAAEYPDEMPKGSSRMQEADIVSEDGKPKLANARVIIDSGELPFRCTMETQNFRPPDEKQLTFSAYGYNGTDVCGIDLATKKITNYSNAPDQYDEPEGIFPDGQHTLVECDRQNHLGPGHIDLWKLKLDGSGETQRLTFFSDVADYKASNPVVSDDGKFFAFQMARANEAAGVGHGIFLYDIEKAEHAK
jgi:hypothetical protein